MSAFRRGLVRIEHTWLMSTLVVFSLVLGIFSFSLSRAAAEEVEHFWLTGASRDCDASQVILDWHTDEGTVIQQVTISISNTSDNWAQILNPSFTDQGTSFVYDHHAIDKVVVDAMMEDGSMYRGFVDVGQCGAAVSFSGARVSPSDDELPTIEFSNAGFSCETMEVSFDYVVDGGPVYISVQLRYGLVKGVLDSFTVDPGSYSYSGTVPWDDYTQLEGGIGVIAYTADEESSVGYVNIFPPTNCAEPGEPEDEGIPVAELVAQIVAILISILTSILNGGLQS